MHQYFALIKLEQKVSDVFVVYLTRFPMLAFEDLFV